MIKMGLVKIIAAKNSFFKSMPADCNKGSQKAFLGHNWVIYKYKRAWPVSFREIIKLFVSWND